MKIQENVDGFGLYGVCTSEFTVEIAADDYSKQLISANAPVTLSVVSGNTFQIAPTFYIATRSRAGSKVTFKCFDRMIFIDQLADIPGTSFINGYISGESLMTIIAEQCGFTAARYAAISGITPVDILITKESTEGKTCRALLETISKAWCGIFKCSEEDELLFVPFGGVVYVGQKSENHTAIVEKGVKGPIEQVVLIGNDEIYTAGSSSADVFGTIKIETEFASQALADNLMERLEGYIYQAWSCGRCIIDAVYAGLEAPSEITFADGSVRVANYMVKIPTAAGVYVECGCNDVVENEFDYTGALSRRIESKIGDGEELGNKTMVTRYQGIVHLGEKQTDEKGNITQNRYGYKAATASGIVEFDGAMVSRVTPTGADISADGKEAVVKYDGKAYKYNIEYDGSGNVTGFAKEEVTE